MYLTRQADYAMRLLIHLAVQPGEATTIQKIAERYGISRNHMMKIAHRAVQKGWVEGARGRGGGLKLAKPAKEIGIGQVLRVMEDWRIVECFNPASNQCSIAGGCGLQPILKEALKAYFEVLDRYTLADAVRRKSFLIQLLGLGTANEFAELH